VRTKPAGVPAFVRGAVVVFQSKATSGEKETTVRPRPRVLVSAPAPVISANQATSVARAAPESIQPPGPGARCRWLPGLSGSRITAQVFHPPYRSRVSAHSVHVVRVGMVVDSKCVAAGLRRNGPRPKPRTHPPGQEENHGRSAVSRSGTSGQFRSVCTHSRMQKRICTTRSGRRKLRHCLSQSTHRSLR
jgi:hypothetical protein